MIVFTQNDRQMLTHITEVINDRMLSDDGYEGEDHATVGKLSAVAKRLEAGPVLVVGHDQPEDVANASSLMRSVLEAELNNWVPNASQRLLHRAATLLGYRFSTPTQEDHGPNPGDHALFPGWLGGVFVRQCATCARVFRD